MTNTMICALIVVFKVVFVITASLQLTLIIVLNISLVVVLMVGATAFWGLYMNMVLTLNMSFCLGVAVDFSTHIAHQYQTEKAPADKKTDQERRIYKAGKALSKMGSSVFHGGFSTFLAIAVLH